MTDSRERERKKNILVHVQHGGGGGDPDSPDAIDDGDGKSGTYSMCCTDIYGWRRERKSTSTVL